MTVKQLLKNISAAELSEWQAFYRVEPFGNTEYGADWRNALLISTLAAVFRGKKVFDLETFVPKRYALLTPGAEKQDPETIKAMLIGALQPTTEKRKKKKHPWGKRKRPKRTGATLDG
jgi:hypothetical protein